MFCATSDFCGIAVPADASYPIQWPIQKIVFCREAYWTWVAEGLPLPQPIKDLEERLQQSLWRSSSCKQFVGISYAIFKRPDSVHSDLGALYIIYLLTYLLNWGW